MEKLSHKVFHRAKETCSTVEKNYDDNNNIIDDIMIIKKNNV